MSKVKLTKEQADAIERITHKEVAVKRHIEGWIYDENKCLNNLELDDFIKALYIGYEIEPEFKVGDIVKDGNDTLREVAEVKENGICLYVNNEITPLGWIGNNSDMYKQLRHATPEEIAEEKQRRFWSDNGREVGEFKKNDILSVKVASYAYTISTVLDGVGGSKLYTLDEDPTTYTKKELLKGFVVACFAHDRKDIKND